MTAKKQLTDYGFTVSEKLDKLLKKLPADSFNQIEFSRGVKKDGKSWTTASLTAKIWLDRENKTDIVITQLK